MVERFTHEQNARLLSEIDAAIAAQEALRGRLPDSALDGTLAELRKQRLLIGGAIQAERKDSATLDAGRYSSSLVEQFEKRLQDATQSYLRFVIERYAFLEMRGMGITDRLPLRVPVEALFVQGKVRAHSIAAPGRLSLSPAAATGPSVGAEASLADEEPISVMSAIRAHKAIVILGDPGSGKTTLVKYLALLHARGESSAAGLEPRLPVVLPASAYGHALARADESLATFVGSYYRERGSGHVIQEVIETALAHGVCLFLLDGLDEIPDAGLRRAVAIGVEEFYSYHREVGNRLLVTSRSMGYEHVRLSLPDGVECNVVDFDDADIADFVDKWIALTSGVGPGARSGAERERSELLAAVHESPGVRRLASNPLLLTILLLMRRQGVVLPDRRVELYETAVGVLVKHWQIARSLGRPAVRSVRVTNVIRVLAPLALWMHETNPVRGIAPKSEVRRVVAALLADHDPTAVEDAVDDFLHDVDEFAGILVERGPGEYSFLHLTFQEYLAAVGLVTRHQESLDLLTDELVTLVGNPVWHEVLMLCIGYLGVIQRRDSAAGRVALGIAHAPLTTAGEAVVVAGMAAAETMPDGVDADSVRTLCNLLCGTMRSDDVSPTRRTRAGRALSQLGDLRPEVADVDAMSFCMVPRGSFWMGAGDAAYLCDDLSYDFLIGRFPVTRAQFEPFVHEGGYDNEGYWTAHGWRWRVDMDAAGPASVDFRFDSANAPVVAVTWHECVAYSKWLTERWRRTGRINAKFEVRLPIEPERVKAVRGGTQIPRQALPMSAVDALRHPLLESAVNDSPRRDFPWGLEFDPERLATGLVGISGPCTVGCFPRGSSPYGSEDMAGNVWEWLMSAWGTEWEVARFGLPYVGSDGREELDAGDDVLRMVAGGSYLVGSSARENVDHVRCSYRTRNGPDVRHLSHGFRLCVVPGR